MKWRNKEVMMNATVYKCEWIAGSETVALIGMKRITIPKENRLEFLQGLVGGYIDIYQVYGHDLVFNDEGMDVLPPNKLIWDKYGFILYGTVIEIDGVLD